MISPRLEVLVKDRSTEQALLHLIPRIVPGQSFSIRSFDGKHSLLKRLPDRLQGYAEQLRFDPDLRIVVIIDLDDDECLELKAALEDAARTAGLPTLRSSRQGEAPVVATRIAVEELGAWFIGDVDALRSAYPRIPSSLALKQNFRLPDGVRGGTWEALERLLPSRGYHEGGLRKIALANEVARHMNPEINRSGSFCCLRDGLRSLINWKVTA